MYLDIIRLSHRSGLNDDITSLKVIQVVYYLKKEILPSTND